MLPLQWASSGFRMPKAWQTCYFCDRGRDARGGKRDYINDTSKCYPNKDGEATQWLHVRGDRSFGQESPSYIGADTVYIAKELQ